MPPLFQSLLLLAQILGENLDLDAESHTPYIVLLQSLQSFVLGERPDEMSERQAYQPLDHKRVRMCLLKTALHMMKFARHDFRDPGQRKGKMSLHGQM